MSNVFKKLISNELGEKNYRRYFAFTKNNIYNRKKDHQIIFDDMYEKLKCRDIKMISNMYNRMNDTLILALRINRNYIFAFIYYLIALILLLSRSLSLNLAITSIFLISICFVYKTYEFIANKFCYIDAQIAMVYKWVLDRIILKEREEKQRKNF